MGKKTALIDKSKKGAKKNTLMNIQYSPTTISSNCTPFVLRGFTVKDMICAEAFTLL